MRWKTPKDDAVRLVRRFAVFPESLSCGCTVWLEWYYQQDRFNAWLDGTGGIWIRCNARCRACN